MKDFELWWPTSKSPEGDQAFSDGSILAIVAAGMFVQLTSEEKARYSEIQELAHDEAFTQSED